MSDQFKTLTELKKYLKLNQVPQELQNQYIEAFQIRKMHESYYQKIQKQVEKEALKRNQVQPIQQTQQVQQIKGRALKQTKPKAQPKQPKQSKTIIRTNPQQQQYEEQMYEDPQEYDEEEYEQEYEDGVVYYQ